MTAITFILLIVYISSVLYYQAEFIEAVSNYNSEFDKETKGFFTCVFCFILGFAPVLNTIFAYKLFETRNK
jgi:hypothetical protein